nr:hypothetical protein [Vallitalea okinawensis]
MQMTLLELNPGICPIPKFTAEDFLAKLSALLEIEEVLKIQEELYSLKSCDWREYENLNVFSLKVFPINGKATNTYIRVGKLEGINGHDLCKRVYSINGISPTLNSCGGGNQELVV